MKSVALILALSLLLSRCSITRTVRSTFSDPGVESDEPSATETDPYAGQLAVIWAGLDSWIKEPYVDAWCYGVTDLDGNGQLEILSSHTQGTGHYVTTRIWEVSPDGTGLVSVENPNEDGNGISITSGYQSGGREGVECFYGGGRYFYIQRITLRISAGEYVETLCAVSYAKGELSRTVLGTMTTEYDPASVTCRDGSGNLITQEAYDAIVQTEFAEFTPVKAEIFWLECVEDDQLTETMLAESWEGFRRG